MKDRIEAAQANGRRGTSIWDLKGCADEYFRRQGKKDVIIDGPNKGYVRPLFRAYRAEILDILVPVSGANKGTYNQFTIAQKKFGESNQFEGFVHRPHGRKILGLWFSKQETFKEQSFQQVLGILGLG